MYVNDVPQRRATLSTAEGGGIMRMYQEDLGQRAGRRGLQAAWLTAQQLAETLAAHVAVVLLGLAAAFSPSYRPTTRSSITPYLGHSFSLLRMTLDPRPQALLSSFTDGLRLLLVL